MRTVEDIRLHIHAGPCGVGAAASSLRSAGWTDLIEGTEHVYATLADAKDYPDALYRARLALGHWPHVTGHSSSAPRFVTES